MSVIVINGLVIPDVLGEHHGELVKILVCCIQSLQLVKSNDERH